jgi:hypothetical protein
MSRPARDHATGSRRRRVATCAIAAISIGIAGAVVVNEVATAGASTRSVAVPQITSKTVTTVRSASPVRKAVRHRRKRKGTGIRVLRPTTTTSTTSKSVTSTTATTVARSLSPSNPGRGRLGRVGRAVATQSVSAHHSGMSASTMILLLLGLAPLILLGFGLVLADLVPRSPRARRRDPGPMPRQH